MARTAADPISTATEQTEAVDKPTSKSDRVLAVSHSVLTILKDVSKLSTVPYLQEAATVACTLLQMVQDMKSNKKLYRDIVQEVCTLLACISLQPGEMSDSLLEDLGELVKALKDIEKLCHKMAARHPIIRFFSTQKDAGEINQIRMRIELTFRVFYLKSTISIRAIQKSWTGKEDSALTQLLLDELKVQRDFMEKTGTTFAALQITASPSPPLDNQTNPAHALQVFHGAHVFEDEVHTDNQGLSGSVVSAPMQSFIGNMRFKGKVHTVNRMTE